MDTDDVDNNDNAESQESHQNGENLSDTILIEAKKKIDRIYR